jgi:hypothetical protein
MDEPGWVRPCDGRFSGISSELLRKRWHSASLRFQPQYETSDHRVAVRALSGANQVLEPIYKKSQQ